MDHRRDCRVAVVRWPLRASPSRSGSQVLQSSLVLGLDAHSPVAKGSVRGAVEDAAVGAQFRSVAVTKLTSPFRPRILVGAHPHGPTYQVPAESPVMSTLAADGTYEFGGGTNGP